MSDETAGARSEQTEGRDSRSVRSVTVAAVLFLVVLLGTLGARSWRDLESARERQAELQEKIEETEVRIDALDRRIHRLRHDPLLVERLAREELGMVQEGDVVFVLPREGSEARLTPPPATVEPTAEGQE